jgi:hypothetical protein
MFEDSSSSVVPKRGPAAGFDLGEDKGKKPTSIHGPELSRRLRLPEQPQKFFPYTFERHTPHPPLSPHRGERAWPPRPLGEGSALLFYPFQGLWLNFKLELGRKAKRAQQAERVLRKGFFGNGPDRSTFEIPPTAKRINNIPKIVPGTIFKNSTWYYFHGHRIDGQISTCQVLFDGATLKLCEVQSHCALTRPPGTLSHLTVGEGRATLVQTPMRVSGWPKAG